MQQKRGEITHWRCSQAFHAVDKNVGKQVVFNTSVKGGGVGAGGTVRA